MNLQDLNPADFPETRGKSNALNALIPLIPLAQTDKLENPQKPNPHKCAIDDIRERVLRIGETWAGVDYWTHAFGSGDSEFSHTHGAKAGEAGAEVCDAYSLLQDKLAKMPEFRHPEVYGAVNAAGTKEIHEKFPNLVDLEIANALLHILPLAQELRDEIREVLMENIHHELKTHGSTRLLAKEKTQEVFELQRFLLDNKFLLEK